MKKICLGLGLMILAIVTIFSSFNASAETYFPNNTELILSGDNYNFAISNNEVYHAIPIKERNRYYAFWTGGIVFNALKITVVYDGVEYEDYIYYNEVGVQGDYIVFDINNYDFANYWQVDLNDSGEYNSFWNFSIGYNQSAVLPKYVNSDIYFEDFENSWKTFSTVAEALTGDYFSGYEQGVLTGDYDMYTEGKNDGLEEGYENGLEDGKDIGFENGKREGLEEGKSDKISIVSFIGNILGAAFNFIITLFSFSIFGISIADILGTIAIAFIGIFIVRLFI